MYNHVVALPVEQVGHRISSWPAGPGTELSAGAAGSLRTMSFSSPPGPLEHARSQTDE